MPARIVPALTAPAVKVRVQPRSSEMGFSMTPMNNWLLELASNPAPIASVRITQP